MIFSALYLCIAKQLFIISSLVSKAHIVLNISDVVLLTDNFTVKYEGPITFLLFYPKNDFYTPNIIWDILYIEISVVHLSSVHFQLYKNIWFVEIWPKCYDLHSFDCEMVQICQYMIM